MIKLLKYLSAKIIWKVDEGREQRIGSVFQICTGLETDAVVWHSELQQIQRTLRCSNGLRSLCMREQRKLLGQGKAVIYKETRELKPKKANLHMLPFPVYLFSAVDDTFAAFMNLQNL